MNSSIKPKVSVLMSVYNGEKYLRESIDSILNQTFQNFEFLIINDGSVDHTWEIILSYSDPRVNLIINDQNIGLTGSLNKGLELARGEYIARMDADDISLPTRLERQVAFMNTHPEIGVLGVNNFVIDERGNELRKDYRPITHEEIMSSLLLENRFVHSSIMFRKTLLDGYGFYAQDCQYAQDYELILRLSSVCKLANLSEFLHKWRENLSTGITTTKRPEQIIARDKIRKEFLEKSFTLDEDYISLILANLRENPQDEILSEYLHKITKSSSLSAASVLKFKRIFYFAKNKFHAHKSR